MAAGRARVRDLRPIITATTMVFAAGLVILNRSYLSPYDDAAGQLVLLLVGVCFAGGFVGLAELGRIGDQPVAVPAAETGAR